MFSSGRAIAQEFKEHFEVRIARTPEQKRRVFQIRGDVYCKEFKYEPEENCPNGLEHDDFDAQSLHCLIIHRKLNVAAGCLRLIMLPDRAFRKTLPFERFVDPNYRSGKFALAELPRESVSECSRLAVHGTFRRKLAESFSDRERTIFPLVTTALFMAGTALSDLSGRSHNFAMIEPRLARLTKQSIGFHWHQIGEVVDYHGPRAPYYVSTTDVLEGMHSRLWALYESVYNMLKLDFATAHGGFAPVPVHPPGTAQPAAATLSENFFDTRPQHVYLNAA